jgi:hypothetical protein
MAHELLAIRLLEQAQLCAAMTPTDEYRKRLLRDGFVRIETMASGEDLTTITSILRRLHHNGIGIKEGAQFDLVGTGAAGDRMRFPQILQPSDFAPALLETRYFRRAAMLARELLGPEARFAGDHALIKPGFGGPETPWHQDAAFRDPAYDREEISIWLALGPVGPDNGCLEFIPGSHRRGVLAHRRLGNDPRVHALECIGDFDPREAVSCPLPAGGITIHHIRTLHRAPPNHSAEDRLAYVLVFDVVPIRADAARAAPWLATPDAREQRARAWRRHGGFVVDTWRKLRRLDLSDGRQLRYVLRRVGRVFRLAR